MSLQEKIISIIKICAKDFSEEREMISVCAGNLELQSKLTQQENTIKAIKEENKELKQQIEDLYSGRLGACHTCEQVAELNIKLQKENEKLQYCVK